MKRGTVVKREEKGGSSWSSIEERKHEGIYLGISKYRWENIPNQHSSASLPSFLFFIVNYQCVFTDLWPKRHNPPGPSLHASAVQSSTYHCSTRAWWSMNQWLRILPVKVYIDMFVCIWRCVTVFKQLARSVERYLNFFFLVQWRDTWIFFSS